MAPQSFTDMMGNSVQTNYQPQRIVSLVPSQTELLFDLGLSDEIVGITKFCVHPAEWFRSKTRVGGTKTVHIDVIDQLQPDLIIANKEENTRQQIEELALRYPTWVSDIKTIADGLQMISQIGAITGRQERAAALIRHISEGFAKLKKSETRRYRVAYFIWRNPWMCAGCDTFISDMIKAIGWENVLATSTRYPEVQLGQLKDKEIDIVLLSSEPYPFKEAHIAEIKQQLPGAAVWLVDGEMFSWYGSRMLPAAQYMAEIKARAESIE